MDSSQLLGITTFAYLLSAVMYVGLFVFRAPRLGPAATTATTLAFLVNTAGIGLRWLESHQMGIGYAPLTNMYESLVFFAWTIALLYLFIERRYGNRVIGAFTMPLAFMAMAYASLSPNISDRIQPLLPALKSNWLIAHVITCFIGYAAFAVAFGLSIMYLIRQREPDPKGSLLDRFPKPKVIDDLTHQMIMFGFLFLSIGIITGAVWANSAWGSYWSWDPKETWSLITWFIYATLLHARLIRGWYGKKIAYLSIVGFVAMLFTYFGVNYLPGLHSYGSF